MKDIQVRSDTSLTNYKPERGVKAIAVAEAAEAHYKRAKDANKLVAAVTHKLTEQRKFVLYWDQHGLKKGGNPTVTAQKRLRDYGLDRLIIHRWRRRLKEDQAFDLALRLSTERCIRWCEFSDKSTAEQIVASTENEWYTPKTYLDAAREVLGAIDLDPASSAKANQAVKAKTFYAHDQNSLTRPWLGRVWLNPPYGRLAGEFVQRLVQEYKANRVTAAIALVNAHCTDTDWFQPLWDELLCFTDHRIDFDSAGRTKDTTSTHGSVFVYFGMRPKAFTERFAPFGAIVARWRL